MDQVARLQAARRALKEAEFAVDTIESQTLENIPEIRQRLLRDKAFVKQLEYAVNFELVGERRPPDLAAVVVQSRVHFGLDALAAAIAFGLVAWPVKEQLPEDAPEDERAG